jgi:hypothetical protein
MFGTSGPSVTHGFTRLSVMLFKLPSNVDAVTVAASRMLALGRILPYVACRARASRTATPKAVPACCT